MQFSNIYGLVQNVFDSSSAYTTICKGWVNATYHDVIGRHPWSWTERTGGVDAVAGQQDYSIVANTQIPDFRSIIDVSWIGISADEVEKVDQQLFDKITLGSSTFTQTSGSTSSGAATVNVASTAGFPSSGFALVGTYVVTYTGITATTLTGVVGVGGTVATLSQVRTIATNTAPTIYALGGGTPETTSAAAVAGGVQKVSIWPAPNAAVPGALQVRYTRGAGSIELTADTDVPIIPTRHHYVLVEGAIALGLLFEDAYIDSSSWQQRYEARIAAMVAEDGGMRHGDSNELVERQPVVATPAR